MIPAIEFWEGTWLASGYLHCGVYVTIRDYQGYLSVRRGTTRVATAKLGEAVFA